MFHMKAISILSESQKYVIFYNTGYSIAEGFFLNLNKWTSAIVMKQKNTYELIL